MTSNYHTRFLKRSMVNRLRCFLESNKVMGRFKGIYLNINGYSLLLNCMKYNYYPVNSMLHKEESMAHKFDSELYKGWGMGSCLNKCHYRELSRAHMLGNC